MLTFILSGVFLTACRFLFSHHCVFHRLGIIDYGNSAPADTGNLVHQVRVGIFLIDTNAGDGNPLANGLGRLFDRKAGRRGMRRGGISVRDQYDMLLALALGVPGKPGQKHPLYEDPKIFYEITRNERVAGPSVPKRADTYILLSAGHDGLYGTEDDIVNFDFRWKPK